ncbi:MAG: TraR/DksA family transcriptional regulator [Candidatus Omnitrophota bacterium]
MLKKMDKKNLLQYKKILLGMKEKIVGEIKQMSNDASVSQKEIAGDSSGHGMHIADIASDMYDREFSLGLASNDRELLYKVNEALQKVNDGNFGICAQCAKPIAVARLKAIPYAQTCLKCQEKLETK